MADNESKVSVEAEISVDTSKANSGLDKTGKTLETLTKGVGGLSSEMDGLVKKFVELQKVAGKALPSMSKDEISKATGLLAKAEQIRSRGNSGGNGKGRKKRKKDGYRTKNKRSNAQANKIEKSTDDVVDSVSDMTELAGDISKSFESMGNSIQSLADTVKSLEKKVSSTDIRAKEANAKALNASTRAKKVEQDAPLVEEKVKTEVTKQILNQAKAGRINDDHRYKARWYGGLASGVGGAISRSRARSGFAGFMSRVGTGVGQKHPGMNIMKGATLSGLGLNPLTLAFSTVGAGIAKLVDGLGQLSVESLQAYGEVERLKTGLSVVFGSDAEANTMFEGIKDYALESPFGVEQTTEMATLLKQSGVYGTELLDTMRMIGDTAGGNEEKFKRIANNYAQIASIGKASMLDMRQFAYAGIPIYKKVAEELGVSQSVLRQMISDGEVTAEIIERVFKTMTSEGGEFYRSVEKGAQTLNARLVNLKDAMSMAKAGFGEFIFKADFLGTGNAVEGEGTLGKLLSWVEDIARKADSWAELKNISRDVAAITGREDAVADLDKEIARLQSEGKDVSALVAKRGELAGMNSDESLRDIFTSQNKYYKGIEERANTEYIQGLRNELEQWKSIDTKGVGKSLKQVISDKIESLDDEISELDDYVAVTKEIKGWNNGKYGTVDTEIVLGNKSLEMTEALQMSSPYAYQTDSLELSKRLFEQLQKSAASSTSLASLAEQSRLRYQESDAGKAELEAKERAEHGKAVERFKRLRSMIDGTGNILEDIKVNLNQFSELMESGIIEPGNYVDLTWAGIARNEGDTFAQARDKAASWQGMGERARDIEHLLYAIPGELRAVFEDIIRVLGKEGSNSRVNVAEINRLTVGLSDSEGFSRSKVAQNLLAYILTENSSALDRMYSYDEIHGKGKDDSYPPLWKRITGAATGVDPNFITNARDFYKLYGSQFEGRNISQGVISGMTASGRDMKDIIRLLKYTGGKSTHKGSVGTPLIDWERTGQSFSDFALSMDASVVEMKALQSALYSQIDVYDKLKETMLTTGEDWDKMSPDKLEEQLWNAFGGIDGAKMIATNSMGEQREVDFNEANELVFKGTDRLLSSQDEFRVNLEETVTALDDLRNAMARTSQQMNTDLLNREKMADNAEGTARAILGQVSAQKYIDKESSSPDAVKEVIGDTVDLLLKEQRDSPADYERRFSEDAMKAAEADVMSAYAAFTGHAPSAMGFENAIEQAVQRAIESLGRTSFSSMADAVAAGDQSAIFLKSVNSFLEAKLAEGMAYDVSGNMKGDAGELAKWMSLLHDSNVDLVISHKALEEANEKAAARQRTADAIKDSDKKLNLLGEISETFGEYKSEGSILARLFGLGNLSKQFQDMALNLGDANLSLEEFSRLQENDFASRRQQLGTYDFEGKAKLDQEEGAYNFQKAKQSGDLKGAISAAGQYAGGKAVEVGLSLIEGTDVGSFVKNTMQTGDPVLGAVGMLIESLGKVIGGMDILAYALNPVTNLMQGLSPLLKVLMLPLVLVSHGLEILGESLESFLTSIFGEEHIKAIDDYYKSLTDKKEQEEEMARHLEALNDLLARTKKSMIEAEEYYLKRNREVNAHWAAQMQGQFVMDTRSTKVDDMILTPHGNFSTAPDDYILAMKDPTALMGGGQAGVSIKFTVNNNASDVVEATASETDYGNGGKELIVTISRMVASDYASGKNGWDAAYAGRERRTSGRRIAR